MRKKHTTTDPQIPDTDNVLPAEQELETVKKRSGVAEIFLAILSGNILSRSEVRRTYPYIIALSFLAFLYIAGIFRTQYLYREYSRLTEQVKELRSRSMTMASERMMATRQSRIIEEIEKRNLPLYESLIPNKVIEVPDDAPE